MGGCGCLYLKKYDMYWFFSVAKFKTTTNKKTLGTSSGGLGLVVIFRLLSSIVIVCR